MYHFSLLEMVLSVSGLDKMEFCFHPIFNKMVEALVDEKEMFYAMKGLLMECALMSMLVEGMVENIHNVIVQIINYY